MLRSTRLTLAIFGVVLAQAAPTFSQSSRGGPNRYEMKVAGQWEQRLKSIDEMILDGEARKARKAAKRLGQEIMDRVVTWDDTGNALGLVTVMRALAAVEDDDLHEGLWYWAMAQQFFPKLSDFDFSAYGETGEILERNLFEIEDSSEDSVASEEMKPLTTPPKVRRRVVPRYPKGKLSHGHEGKMIVRVVIGTDGLPRSPRIVESAGELTMVYSALESLREWRFEPARLDGEPIEVFYTLTVNFKRRR